MTATCRYCGRTITRGNSVGDWADEHGKYLCQTGSGPWTAVTWHQPVTVPRPREQLGANHFERSP
jgi:hypothetical protein